AESRPWMAGDRPWEQDADRPAEHTPWAQEGQRAPQRSRYRPRAVAPGITEHVQLLRLRQREAEKPPGISDGRPGRTHTRQIRLRQPPQKKRAGLPARPTSPAKDQ